MKEAYTDRFEFSLDDKGRVSVPAEWRGEAFEKRFLVMPSEEGCLRVYPASFLGRQLEKLSAEGATSTDVRRRSLEKLASVMQSVEPDQQGRVMIREKFRQHAGLNRQAVLVGRLDHFDIWEPRRWQKVAPPALTFEQLAKEAGL
ncbi:MAG: division/cell wall cluster transcriptional repressor MraZ [Verrucomicrobia bacterium]|nr:division/cell wall cluster transcriptional repressor MraZ [Verrucomicrobiota bacterium]NBR63309.1 division/cell wall cluster transcriptional repressor MraZ [Verrucomicrobiota bacterium]